MKKLFPKAAHGIGGEKPEAIFSKNHFASATPIPHDVQAYIDQFSMHRVAGNVWACPSSKDFWQVKGGKIMKLVGSEVDNGESIPAASGEAPMSFISNMLDELEF